MAIIDLTTIIGTFISDLFNYGFLIVTLLIWVIGFYVYFTKEKETKALLISLTFFFFFLASLAVPITLLENDILSPWALTFNFLGSIFAFVAVEPWKSFSN